MAEMILKNKLDFALKDPTSYSLLISNIVVIIFSILEKISLMEIIFIFYFQSIAIGIFMSIRILKYKGTVKEFDLPGDNLKGNYKGQKLALFFIFLIQFFFFHFVYLFFIGFPSIELMILIAPYISLFFISHLFSYMYFDKYKKEVLSVKKIQSIALNRALPIHVFIIFFGFISGLLYLILEEVAGLGLNESIYSSIGIIFFLIIKTVTDLNSHIVQHVDEGIRDKKR